MKFDNMTHEQVCERLEHVLELYNVKIVNKEKLYNSAGIPIAMYTIQQNELTDCSYIFVIGSDLIVDYFEGGNCFRTVEELISQFFANCCSS